MSNTVVTLERVASIIHTNSVMFHAYGISQMPDFIERIIKSLETANYAGGVVLGLPAALVGGIAGYIAGHVGDRIASTESEEGHSLRVTGGVLGAVIFGGVAAVKGSGVI